MTLITHFLRALWMVFLVCKAPFVVGDESAYTTENHFSSIRNSLVNQLFFENLKEAEGKLNVPAQVQAQKEEIGKNLYWATRIHSASEAFKSWIPIIALGLPLAIKRHLLVNQFNQLPEAVRTWSLAIAPFALVTARAPVSHAIWQGYYALFPPELPEANLVRLYGSKKHLFSAGIQSYIENDIFYALWESSQSNLLEKAYAVLDKALRLPLMIRPLHYRHDLVMGELEDFPPEVSTRLAQFARTEVAYQNMSPRINHRHVLYLQGKYGTGKMLASRKLAKGMGTTLATFSLENAELADIVGTPYEVINAKAGRLLSALIANTRSRESINHNNQILVIEGFDQLLLSNDPSAGKIFDFIESLLDPSRDTFYSPYLRGNVDIPEMIFLSGTRDIQVLANQSSRMQELVKRLEVVYFEGFDADAKFNIARQTIIPRMEKSYRSLGGAFAEFSLPEATCSELKAFLETDNDPGLQSLELYLVSLFERYL